LLDVSFIAHASTPTLNSSSTPSEGLNMNSKSLIAVAMLAVAVSHGAHAEDTGPDMRLQTPSALTKAQVRAELAAARAAGALPVAGEYGPGVQPAASSLTRSEVLADYVLWKEAGLAEFQRGDAGPDLSGASYLQARAKYVQLRSSPRYGDIVRQVQRQRGETPTASTGNDHVASR
jgi:hypothetical protein